MCLFLCNCAEWWRERQNIVSVSAKQTCFLWAVNHKSRINWDSVTDLLWVALCERQFSWDMEHDFSPMKGSKDCFTSSLTMTHIQASSEPEKREWKEEFTWLFTLHVSFLQLNISILYPVKPCSWIVSPRIDRNSLKSSLSSLLLSISSSVSYTEMDGVWEEVIIIWCHSNFYECRTLRNKEPVLLTCPSFWYKMPNLKLGDTLCSSNAVMSSGAWRISGRDIDIVGIVCSICQ